MGGIFLLRNITNEQAHIERGRENRGLGTGTYRDYCGKLSKKRGALELPLG